MEKIVIGICFSLMIISCGMNNNKTEETPCMQIKEAITQSTEKDVPSTGEDVDSNVTQHIK